MQMHWCVCSVCAWLFCGTCFPLGLDKFGFTLRTQNKDYIFLFWHWTTFHICYVEHSSNRCSATVEWWLACLAWHLCDSMWDQSMYVCICARNVNERFVVTGAWNLLNIHCFNIIRNFNRNLQQYSYIFANFSFVTQLSFFQNLY